MKRYFVTAVSVLAVSALQSGNPGGLLHAQARPAHQAPADSDWPMHNRDLQSTRFSPLTQITPANAGTLAVKWSYQAEAAVGAETPLVIDGVMYLNMGSAFVAIDAASGMLKWRS